MIRQWSCDEHVKCVAYDTEVLPAGEDGADRGPFVAVLAASGMFQIWDLTTGKLKHTAKKVAPKVCRCLPSTGTDPV